MACISTQFHFWGMYKHQNVQFIFIFDVSKVILKMSHLALKTSG